MPALGNLSSRLEASARGVWEGVGALGPREAGSAVVAGFREHDLLVEASAIAFRVLLALIPCTLFVLGLLGFLSLDEVWRQDAVPAIRPNVSPAAFKVIDDVATHVLGQEQLFWVTAGLSIAVWEVSGVVRAVAKILNRIYGVEESRSYGELLRTSVLVGAAVGMLLLAALAVVRLGPLVLDDVIGKGAAAAVVGFALRWSLALGFLLGAVGLMVRAGPDLKRPLRWVSFGALVVVLAWALMSALFAAYLTQIADYGSVFGNLATVFILVEYLFLASVVFVGGLLVDRLVQERAGG
jgi:membrane protein